MKKHVVETLIFSLMALFVLVSLNSVLFRVLAPYEPRRWFIGPRTNPYEEELRRQFGWDQPLHTRCVAFVANMFTFNFGRSFINLRSVNAELWRHLPYTLLVFVPAFIFMIMVSVPLEVYCSTRRGRTVKMKLLSVGAGLLPWAVPAKNRLIDAQLEDCMFLRRAMGFSEYATIYRLMFTNMLPLVPMLMACSIFCLVFGTLMAEHLLSLPGIGTWFTWSLRVEDRPVIEALLFVYEILTVSAYFAISLMSSKGKTPSEIKLDEQKKE